MKTLMMYEGFSSGGAVPREGDTVFLEFEGDLREFDSVLINASAPEGFEGGQKRYDELCEKLNKLIYDENGVERDLAVLSTPTKDWDFFVRCGLLL